MEPCGFAIDDMSISERALFSSDTNAPGRDSSSPPLTSSHVVFVAGLGRFDVARVVILFGAIQELVERIVCCLP